MGCLPLANPNKGAGTQTILLLERTRSAWLSCTGEAQVHVSYAPSEVEVTKSKPHRTNPGNPAAQGRTVVPLLIPKGSYGLGVSVVEILRVTTLNTVFKYKYMKTMC